MLRDLLCGARSLKSSSNLFTSFQHESIRARAASLCNFSSSVVLSKIFTVNDKSVFTEKVMNSEVPVIVNFHADWCEPCKILTPKLEKLIGPMENINLAVVDVEKNADLAHIFEVKAVPAVLAVRNGCVVDKFIGLVDGAVIETFVEKLAKETQLNE